MEGETATSLASRLAAANGISSLTSFCTDMKLSFRGLRTGRAEDLSHLSALAAADAIRLQESTIVSNRKNITVSGHRVKHNYLVRQRPRICPRCIMEDLDEGSGPLTARPWSRAAWSVSLVRTCPRHRVLLQEIETDVPLLLSEDICMVVRHSLDTIKVLADKAETMPHSGLEDWAAARLAGSESGSAYLASLSFCGAVRLVEMIGASSIHGKKFSASKLTNLDWLEAGRAGFPIVSRGERSLLDYLARFHDGFRRTTRIVGGQVLYGSLYTWLSLVEGDDLDAVKSSIREQVIDSFPVGPGDAFLGTVDRRRWHSVQTAAQEFGLNPVSLRRLLGDAGLIDPSSDKASPQRVVFEAEAAASLLTAAKAALRNPDAQRYAGVTRDQWERLVSGGFIQPIVVPKRTQPLFAKQDIDAFFESVGYSTGGAPTSGLVPVPRAIKRATCSLVDVVQLLLKRQLRQVDVDQTKTGFNAILVSVPEVKEALPPKVSSGLTPRLVAEQLGVNPTVVANLISAGHIRHAVQGSFANRSGTRLVSPDDVRAFASEYVSLPQAAAEGGISSKALKARLDERGIRPTFEKAEVGGYFYRRADLAAE